MIKDIKKILESPEDFKSYREKLNYVSACPIPHEGEPNRYPALAITSYHDDQLGRPRWKHQFIYSNLLEDLIAIYENVDEEGIETIAKDQKELDKKDGEKELSSESGWNAFWDEIEKVSPTPEAGCRTVPDENNEEKDFLLVQSCLRGNTDNFVKAANWFLNRWPGSEYKQPIIYWLTNLRYSKPANEKVSVRPGVESNKTSSSVSRKMPEVRFVEED